MTSDVVGRRPSDEVTAVATELHRLASRLTGPEAQGSGQDQAVVLDGIASKLYDDRPAASGRLHQVALTVERLGARYGGYDHLRPMLDLAARLQVVRDEIDPVAKGDCPQCRQLIRRTPEGELEQHSDQAGAPCTGTR